jgi:transporter family-2 protein
LGVTATVVLIVTGQLVTGLLVDHFGLLDTAIRPLDLSRIIGVAVLFAGVYLIVR